MRVMSSLRKVQRPRTHQAKAPTSQPKSRHRDGFSGNNNPTPGLTAEDGRAGLTLTALYSGVHFSFERGGYLMTKPELSDQIETFLLQFGARPRQAKAYAEGFPVNFSLDTMEQIRNIDDWDDASKRKLIASFSSVVQQVQ